jgi:hypothetical protein
VTTSPFKPGHTFALIAFRLRGRLNETIVTWGISERIETVRYSYRSSRGCGIVVKDAVMLVFCPQRVLHCVVVRGAVAAVFRCIRDNGKNEGGGDSWERLLVPVLI